MKWIEFWPLYRANILNLFYPDYADVYEPTDHERKLKEIILTLANNTQMVTRLQTAYYLGKADIDWILARIDYKRGFRLFLAQLNPYKVCMKAWAPINFALHCKDKYGEIIPTGLRNIKDLKRTMKFPLSMRDLGPKQPRNFIDPEKAK